MKKMILMVTILFASLLLAGCIKIPLGNGETLTISSDGFNIEADGEAEDETTQDDEKEGDNGETTDDESEKDIETTGEAEDEAEAEADEGESNETEGESLDCQEDYATFTERVPPNFPMPDCVTDVRSSIDKKEEYTYYTGSYRTSGSWKDIQKLYKDYLLAEYDITGDNEGSASVDLEYLDEEFKIYITIEQKEEGIVAFYFWHTVYHDKEE